MNKYQYLNCIQFSLVCDRAWIPSTITSLQMAGIFVGNVACGQVADLIGRKKPFFLAILSLVFLNVVSAFATSWIMFAALRFFLGIAMGFQITVMYNLAAEFTLVSCIYILLQICLFIIRRQLQLLKSQFSRTCQRT